jgi:Eukaryotic protein of unknown function (DUF842)
MSGSNAQVQASQLNLKLETAAKDALDEIDKRHIRRIGKQTHACIVKCYDKAGHTQSSESLEHCSRQCQQSHVQANQIVQEVGKRVASFWSGHLAISKAPSSFFRLLCIRLDHFVVS